MADKSANLSQPKNYKLIVEKDVKIPLRDGTILYADIFRPEGKTEGGAERFPAIMNISVYQKDKVWIPPADLEEKANPHMNWETVNPEWWCPRGYACVRIDSRGTGKSPGKSDPSSYQESVDFYDAIEWVAKLPWCSGSIGTLGISYHASSQWRVANLQPPSLKCIMPWEGRADQYRDQAYHGGIFSLGFIGNWWLTHTAHHLLGRPRSYNPDAFHNDMMWNMMRNNLDSEWWRQCSARWESIKVPVYSVGNWGGYSLHLRGNTEGYMNAASKVKKLRIHTGTHFHPFHSEEGRLDQLRWMDHWLKGKDTGILDEPPVKLEIRTGGSEKPYPFRTENEWPIARTQWTKAYLRIDREQGHDEMAAEGELVLEPPEVGGQAELPGERRHQGRRRLGLVAVDDPRRRWAAGRVVPERADAGGERNHRPARDEPVGFEHDGRHGHLRHAAQHRRRRQGSLRGRAARPAGAAHQGVAARLAPQARPGEVAAVSPVSSSQRAPLVEPRRAGRVPDRDLAHFHRARQRATGCAWTSSRATALGARRIRTITRITTLER